MAACKPTLAREEQTPRSSGRLRSRTIRFPKSSMLGVRGNPFGRTSDYRTGHRRRSNSGDRNRAQHSSSVDDLTSRRLNGQAHERLRNASGAVRPDDAAEAPCRVATNVRAAVTAGLRPGARPPRRARLRRWQFPNIVSKTK
jgi:hypothetical protein